jgi:hypothetical protein
MSRRKRTAAAPSMVSTAIEQFAQVVARSDLSIDALTTLFADGCRQARAVGVAQTEHVYPPKIAHVLTWWYTDPLYLDQQACPLALPLRGAVPSLESLCRKVDASLDPAEVAEGLLARGVLKRIGRRVQPTERVLLLRGQEVSEHRLRMLVALLRTVNHNATRAEEQPLWSDLLVYNPKVPARLRDATREQLKSKLVPFSLAADSLLQAKERSRRKGEKTTNMGLGLFYFDGLDTTSERPPSKRRRRT